MEVSALAPTRMRKQNSQKMGRTIWTPEEDELLRSLVSQNQPNSWSVLAKYFPNKTSPQIAGRWEKVLNPNLVKGSWTREEDEVVLKFVAEHGDKDWAKLALLLNGRTGKQCRERFKNHLDPAVHRSAWTQEEDQRLITLHAQFGNQWTLISSYFEGRTDNCIKNRWNSTLKKRLERIEKGEPLIRKRGRKPKGFSDVPKPPEIVPDSCDMPAPCSSPIMQKTFEVVQIVPLITDQLAPLVCRRPAEQAKLLSLEENRLHFQQMLSSIV